jgi:predicted dehydrogenase
MKKVKVGVLGAYRGSSMIRYCKIAENAEVVAVCDKFIPVLERQKEQDETGKIAFYDNFEDFIKHDMDAVVLANYANEHAPFAIRCLKEGKHVFSEVLPVQTMKEAVELVETVEETGKVYAYGENYCWFSAVNEMTKLYKQNIIGEIIYADCEYLHNCEQIWPGCAYGDKNHWRNYMFSTFYCTHSLGPIIHMSGLRPVSVTGFESAHNERQDIMGAKTAAYGIEMVTLENGAVIRSAHGNMYKDSIWWRVHGTKGLMETAREETDNGKYDRIYVNYDEQAGAYETTKRENYMASEKFDELAKKFEHGGSDFWSMYHFIEKIKGKEDADVIDVYQALDMCLCGHFAYRSILDGGKPQQIPNLRLKEERDKWRNDVSCTDPKVAGDSLWPTRKTGTPEIPDEVYKQQEQTFYEQVKNGTGRFGAITGTRVKK